jgi:hypothetical protein
MTRGKIRQQEVELEARHRRRAAVAEAAQREKRRGQRKTKQGGVREDLFVISKEFRDPSVN